MRPPRSIDKKRSVKPKPYTGSHHYSTPKAPLKNGGIYLLRVNTREGRKNIIRVRITATIKSGREMEAKL